MSRMEFSMSSLAVYLDGQQISTESDEDLKTVRDYIDSYLRLKARKIGKPTSSKELERESTKTDTGPPSPMFDRVTAAYNALGKPATGDEVYEKMVELGFPLTAKNPREAVKTYLRQPNGKFVKAGVDANGVTLWAPPGMITQQSEEQLILDAEVQGLESNGHFKQN